jgi:hypothetical protein
MSKRFSDFENMDSNVDINMAWKLNNRKLQVSPGHYELQQHKR